MDIYCSIPFCITKDQSQDEHVVFDDQFYSNNSTGVENMFPEHVRLLSDPESEPRCEKISKIHLKVSFIGFSIHFDLFCHFRSSELWRSSNRP